VTQSHPIPARVLAALFSDEAAPPPADLKKWPYPRDQMSDPALILARMAEDVAEIAARERSACILDLLEIGWPFDVAKTYWPAAATRADSVRIEAAARAVFAPDPEPDVSRPGWRLTPLNVALATINGMFTAILWRIFH